MTALRNAGASCFPSAPRRLINFKEAASEQVRAARLQRRVPRYAGWPGRGQPVRRAGQHGHEAQAGAELGRQSISPAQDASPGNAYQVDQGYASTQVDVNPMVDPVSHAVQESHAGQGQVCGPAHPNADTGA